MSRQSAAGCVQIEKGAAVGPLLFTGEVGLPFLAGLLLPALGFLRHCLLSPPSCGNACESARAHPLVAAAWHAHRMTAFFASGHLPCFGRASSKVSQSSFTRDGDEFTILIPDVDSKRERSSVKHNRQKKSKKSPPFIARARV